MKRSRIFAAAAAFICLTPLAARAQVQAECRAFATEQIEQQREDFKRLGVPGDIVLFKALPQAQPGLASPARAEESLEPIHVEPLASVEVALPVAGRPLPDGVVISDFVDPDDVAAWLDVNNRAFDAHPEQGGWDRATFDARRSEAWFRAEDLRIARLEGRVVGSCWTKRTDDPGRPPIGEIYVIGVDPSTQGLGLGPALVAEGLDHLARRCGAEIGMLYVDAANESAVGLYRSLGFHVAHTNQSYIRTAHHHRGGSAA